MKIVFTGPSTYQFDLPKSSTVFAPPAAQGDIASAVIKGATAIGLIDGNFESVASVWHKEILFAISEGVTVCGAASMGALRAAECAHFGMIAIGKIANEYLSGQRANDADVAIQHGPEELGYPPTSQALVNVEATVSSLLSTNLISKQTAILLQKNATAIFFKNRNVDTLFSDLPNHKAVREAYVKGFVNQKQIDAIDLIDFVEGLPDERSSNIADFTIETPVAWSAFLSKALNQT